MASLTVPARRDEEYGTNPGKDGSIYPFTPIAGSNDIILKRFCKP
jgi:hypothetical protein